MSIFWAQVDADGRIIKWGASHPSDIKLQPIEEGLRIVERPEHVTGFENWVFKNDEWIKDRD